jgi:hypothetical protein
MVIYLGTSLGWGWIGASRDPMKIRIRESKIIIESLSRKFGGRETSVI